MSVSSHPLLLAGFALAVAFTGCATQMPVTARDRSLILTAKEILPTLPDRARNEEDLDKRNWPDGSVDVTYSYKGRHDGVSIFLYSTIGVWPTENDALIAREESDSDHRRLLFALEQRASDTFIPAGPDAKTNLLFAGMQPVGISFSTQLGKQTYHLLCLAPPRFFNPYRTRDAIMERIERMQRVQP